MLVHARAPAGDAVAAPRRDEARARAPARRASTTAGGCVPPARALAAIVFLALLRPASAFQPSSKTELKTAVDEWCAGTSPGSYGGEHISNWNTSLITSMSWLFYNMDTFNDEIGSSSSRSSSSTLRRPSASIPTRPFTRSSSS